MKIDEYSDKLSINTSRSSERGQGTGTCPEAKNQ